MVTSAFRLEVEMRLSCACATKNTQCNPYLWLNRRNFRILKEIGVEECDVDVKFYTRSGNMAGSCMRNASGLNYKNSSFIVDLAMGQIPLSTERIYLVIIIIIFIRMKDIIGITYKQRSKQN